MWVQKVPGGGVVALAFAPDGQTLYTADRAGWVTAWDPLTHDGRRLFQLAPDDRGSGVRLYALPDGALFTYAAATESGVVWSRDGRERSRVPGRLVSRAIRLCGAQLYTRTERDDDAVGTWELVGARPGPTLSGWELLGRLRTFDLAPDGRTVALTDTRGTVVLFDLDTKRERHRFEPVLGAWHLEAARFTPDGETLLLVAGPRVQFWDIAARGPVAEVVLGHWPHFERGCSPTAPLFAALDRAGALTVYRTPTGEPVRSLDFALGAQVLCAAFAPDGLTCAVGGSNKQLAVFDVDL